MPEEDASERGQRILTLLETAGQHAGLKVQREYPVVGGRIDLVWLWNGPSVFPAVLPLVGFEVESSWRTRKHLKGDYLNLVDLQPALGVIVLLGEGEDVESTRRFARQMIDRRPGRMEIWAEADALRFGEGQEANQVVALLTESGSTEAEEVPSTIGYKGKYREVSAWLARQSGDRFDVTFAQVEEILGFPLPPSARKHNAYWSGGQPGSTVGNAIRDAGWRAFNLNLAAERVTLEKVRAGS